MDWMTAAIEAVGVLIFCIWIVVPVREFGQIVQQIRQRNHSRAGSDDDK